MSVFVKGPGKDSYRQGSGDSNYNSATTDSEEGGIFKRVTFRSWSYHLYERVFPLELILNPRHPDYKNFQRKFARRATGLSLEYHHFNTMYDFKDIYDLQALSSSL